MQIRQANRITVPKAVAVCCWYQIGLRLSTARLVVVLCDGVDRLTLLCK